MVNPIKFKSADHLQRFATESQRTSEYIGALGASSDGLREDMTAGEAMGALTALAVDFGAHPSVLRLVEELAALSPNARAALLEAGDCGVLTQDGSEITPGLQI